MALQAIYAHGQVTYIEIPEPEFPPSAQREPSLEERLEALEQEAAQIRAEIEQQKE